MIFSIKVNWTYNTVRISMISKQIKLRLLLSEIKIHITEPCSLQAVLAASLNT